MNRVPKMRTMLRISLTGMLACMVTIGMCGWVSSCGTALHKACVAADAIATGLHTAADLNHELEAQGQITLEERQQVATLIDQASQANDELVGTLNDIRVANAPLTAASITQAFDKFLVRLDGLEKNGVLHLKSTAAQSRFETVLGAIRVQVRILQALIGTSTSENRQPFRLPQDTGFLMFAVVFTPEEIAELALLAATLAQKLAAIKGKSDAELLADATAENGAARKQAQADEGAE